MKPVEFQKEFGPYITRHYGRNRPERIRVRVGFTCIFGNRGPYLSLGYDRADVKLGIEDGKPQAIKESEIHWCGALREIPDDVPGLQFLADLVPFHLFDPEHGPMHYEANALYRLQQAAHEHDGTIHAPRETEEQLIQYFASGVCYGVLPEDREVTAVTRAKVLMDISDDGRKLWLRNRLPKLKLRFREVVMAAGLAGELSSALEWFRTTT